LNKLILKTIIMKNRGTTEVTELQQRMIKGAKWAILIQKMSIDQIEVQELLCSTGKQTKEILLFRTLLTEEYNNRKQLNHYKKHGRCF